MNIWFSWNYNKKVTVTIKSSQWWFRYEAKVKPSSDLTFSKVELYWAHSIAYLSYDGDFLFFCDSYFCSCTGFTLHDCMRTVGSRITRCPHPPRLTPDLPAWSFSSSYSCHVNVMLTWLSCCTHYTMGTSSSQFFSSGYCTIYYHAFPLPPQACWDILCWKCLRHHG